MANLDIGINLESPDLRLITRIRKNTDSNGPEWIIYIKGNIPKVTLETLYANSLDAAVLVALESMQNYETVTKT